MARGAKALDRKCGIESVGLKIVKGSEPIRSCVYRAGREPVIRISTSLLALCCQSGMDAALETPTRARNRSNGSRSLRKFPLLIARFTSASIAPWI